MHGNYVLTSFRDHDEFYGKPEWAKMVKNIFTVQFRDKQAQMIYSTKQSANSLENGYSRTMATGRFNKY